MKKIELLLLISLLIYSSMNAQKNISPPSKSIYTFKISPVFSSFETVNRNLNLNNLSFIFVNKETIDNGIFKFDFKDIGKNPTSFILDDYKDYQNNNFLKGFLRKYDPTLWNSNKLRFQIN